MFYSEITVPNPATQVNATLPRAWSPGGLIENVKRAVVTGLREAFRGTSMATQKDENAQFYIDIEYPTAETDYPGIWVQFAIESLQRAGIAMEEWEKDEDNNWTSVQQWMFNGRITLTIAALTSKDRDRLADTVVAQLAFSRPPDLVIRDKTKNTNQMRGLISALNNNPYVQMTLNTDMVQSQGQTVSNGLPWAPNLLLYEDAYSMTCVGQFNIRYSHDGAFSLRAINVKPVMSGDAVAYSPTQWIGNQPAR
jgi:hypothetical protein